VPLLTELSTRQLWQLSAGASESTAIAGQPIVAEGEDDDALWILLRGRARVERRHGPADAPLAIYELRAGDFFGEIALFDAGPRSATVVALEPCRLLKLSRLEVESAIEQIPGLALGICRALARRLRQTSARLGDPADV